MSNHVTDTGAPIHQETASPSVCGQKRKNKLYPVVKRTLDIAFFLQKRFCLGAAALKHLDILENHIVGDRKLAFDRIMKCGTCFYVPVRKI